MMNKPFSPACERNKEAIAKVLREVISPSNKRLLEVGSGTGQHAVYMAPLFKELLWVTSDLQEMHPGIKLWMQESQVANIAGPIEFAIGKNGFPKQKFDLVFTANTFHIMSWKHCKTLMKYCGEHLVEGAQVIIYGPLNYQGKFTSPSNEEFNQSLKERDHASGIRSFEDVNMCMMKNGFQLYHDFEMPANNRTLVFTKKIKPFPREIYDL